MMDLPYFYLAAGPFVSTTPLNHPWDLKALFHAQNMRYTTIHIMDNDHA
jgi:hypothetical protein